MTGTATRIPRRGTPPFLGPLGPLPETKSRLPAEAQLTVQDFFAQLSRKVRFRVPRWLDNTFKAENTFGTVVYGASRTDNPGLNFVRVTRTVSGEDADFVDVIMHVIGLIDPVFAAAGAKQAVRGATSQAAGQFVGGVGKYTFRTDQGALTMEAEHK